MYKNIDELWPGGPKYAQTPEVFKLGSDSVLLAWFAKLTRVRKICDLGSGGGIIPVLLSSRSEEVNVDGVEFDPAAVELSQYNIGLNGLEKRIKIIKGDIREYRNILEAGSYDLAISNPPYFTVGSGYESAKLSTARGEAMCGLNDICAAAAYSVRWGGCFDIVFRPERLSELLCTLTANGLEPKRLRMVQYKAESAPNLILVESRRGGNPGLVVEPPLIMADSEGRDTPEIRKIYRRGEQ